jgi:hypothetical protein
LSYAALYCRCIMQYKTTQLDLWIALYHPVRKNLFDLGIVKLFSPSWLYRTVTNIDQPN